MADERQPLALLFNDPTGDRIMREAIDREHAFVEYEACQTVDEEGTAAWLLVVHCETADPDELYAMLAARLPDYVRARRFPPSRLDAIRAQMSE